MRPSHEVEATPALRARATAANPAAPIEVTTCMEVHAPPERLWERLMFYEQLDERPPVHLRLLLPVPIDTIGRKSEVGDEARCLYEGGYLIKRVTEVDPERRYAFIVSEQALDIGGGMRLSGGEYTVREVSEGRSELEIVTRYTSPKWPRWLWQPIERAVCHSFHRHILSAIRRAAEGR